MSNQNDHVEHSDCEAVINREEFERSLSNVWGYSATGLEAKRAAMSMLATKTGMYSRVPLFCKGDGCPYAESCKFLAYNLAPEGEPCPMETAMVERNYLGYEQDFGITEDNATFTDRNLIADLINHDIMLERCKALIQSEGVLVQDVVAGIAENGEAFYRPEISKNWEAYERVQKKRNEIYDLMLATRKNKKGDDPGTSDTLSTMMNDIMSTTDFVVEEKPDSIDVEYKV